MYGYLDITIESPGAINVKIYINHNQGQWGDSNHAALADPSIYTLFVSIKCSICNLCQMYYIHMHIN